MAANTGLILLGIVIMVTASLTPGVGAAVASVSEVSSHLGDSPFASTTVGALNWAGYAGLGSANGTVTAVSGTWVQPAVTCLKSGSQYLATWVGIDGFNSDDLVQTGTGAQCSGGSASYNAWWEVLPAPETPISSITVHAGDTISASVTYSTSTHKFTMTITDGTHSFSKTKAVPSTARNSAECIVERPEVSGSLARLAKFKTDTFSSCTATISGTTGGIGLSPSVYRINMYNNAGTKIIALTSGLTSEKSFTVTWKGYS